MIESFHWDRHCWKYLIKWIKLQFNSIPEWIHLSNLSFDSKSNQSIDPNERYFQVENIRNVSKDDNYKEPDRSEGNESIGIIKYKLTTQWRLFFWQKGDHLLVIDHWAYSKNELVIDIERVIYISKGYRLERSSVFGSIPAYLTFPIFLVWRFELLAWMSWIPMEERFPHIDGRVPNHKYTSIEMNGTLNMDLWDDRSIHQISDPRDRTFEWRLED